MSRWTLDASRSGAAEQRAHGLDAERGEGDDLRVLQPSQVAEQRAQRVTRADLRVAVGEHEQDGEGFDAAHEVTQASTDASSIHWTSSTTTVVGSRDDGRDDEGLDVAAGRRRRQNGRLGLAELREHVPDRTQRTRRRERVAEPAHDAHPAGRGRGDAEQARLARSCLAGDGDHPPRPGALAHRPAEPRELGLALQEPHLRRVGRWPLARTGLSRVRTRA